MKPRVQVYVLIVSLLVILAGVACTKAADDNQLTGQIRRPSSMKTRGYRGKPITVQTSSGVVTLSGTVDNETQRAAAARYASAIPGIKEVVSNFRSQIQRPPHHRRIRWRGRGEYRRGGVKRRAGLPRSRRAPASTEMAESDPPPAMRATAAEPPAPAQAATPSAPATPPPPPAPVKVTSTVGHHAGDPVGGCD